MSESFSVEFCGNLEACRLEAKISRASAPPGERLVALVYDTSQGIVVRYFGSAVAKELPGLETAIAEARAELPHYVNRKGENPPAGITRPGLALWLTERDDETVMGRSIE